MEASTAKRPSLVLIIEPIESADAVQFKFVSSVGRCLLPWFRVTLTSTYINPGAITAFQRLGLEVLAPTSDVYIGNQILARFGLRNESMLWSEAWFRESVLSANRRLISKLQGTRRYDHVINVTNTCVWESDVWWAQGPPLHVTLDSMWARQKKRPLIFKALRPVIRLLDHHLTRRLHRSGRVAVSASNYVGELYRRLGFPIVETIYNLTDFSTFQPMPRENGPPYVVTYIGKETELDTLFKLVEQGIRIVGFGNKLIPRSRRGIEYAALDFRGQLTHAGLVKLYSGAQFTVFPFTNEPLGYVPIESMACGTPVLTYGREGPAETVIDGETGWLVQSQSELVLKAIQLWNGFDKAWFRERALSRASELKPATQARKLAELILGGANRSAAVTPGVQ